MIVGDPGAGQSTFLRRAVHTLCESLLGVRKRASGQDAFPVLIRVSDLSEFLGKPGGHSEAPDSPMWIVHFLEAQCESIWGLDEHFFLQQLKEGPCLLAFDGLDEAPRAEVRERLARMVEKAARVWPKTRIVVTTRPQAYSGDVLLSGFTEARIGNLDTQAVQAFLHRWSEALFPESPDRATTHARELVEAVQSRSEIRRIAQNPVMLTALAVLHWNEKRLPQQRADLYESVLTWLSRSRKQRRGRPAPEHCIALLQELARAMQEHPEGRQVQVSREWAASVLAPRFREIDAPEEQRERADAFLSEEELDSGIVIKRGPDIRFWHLTFQEHLAAHALAAEGDAVRRTILFVEQRAWRAEWREVILLLAGILHQQQKVERVDALVSAALDTLGRNTWHGRLRTLLGTGPSLTEQARCVGLLGAILLDLQPLKYKPADPRYDDTLQAVMGIFDAQRADAVPLKVRVEAAEALGQAGDPRLRQHNWVRIPAGTFVMGQGDEAHEVELDAFEIARYPATVEEFAKFVEEGGPKPSDWDAQILYPNRPVVGVDWFQASAYCEWAGVSLPTEAEWERAARGVEGRTYPWGNEEPDATRANYADAKVGAPTPVGLFPNGATPDGIHDMAGNVWEWVADCYAEYPRRKQRNPKGPGSGGSRVMRGGAWSVNSTVLRAAYRNRLDPGNRSNIIVFRCAREMRSP